MDILSALVRRANFALYRFASVVWSWRVVKFAGRSFRMRTTTANEVHRVVTFATKEPETIRWIDGFSEHGSESQITFFDIGANVGIYSLYVKARHPTARVFAFEPESQSFASLCQNIRGNNFLNIIPYQFAISDRQGLGELHVASLDAGAGAASLGTEYQFVRPDARRGSFRQGVFQISLDHLVSEFGLPVPNFLKIDVDGLESEIIYAAKNTLTDPKLRSLLVEFQFEAEGDLNEMVSFLKECGLSLFEKSEWISGQGSIQSQNFIFTRDGIDEH